MDGAAEHATHAVRAVGLPPHTTDAALSEALEQLGVPPARVHVGRLSDGSCAGFAVAAFRTPGERQRALRAELPEGCGWWIEAAD